MRTTTADLAATDRDIILHRKSWFAVGGGISAVLASSCCIAPLLLLSLGVSGAWIGNLTALEPFKPWFIAVALAFIALGFWQVYFKTKPACDEGTYCARPESSVLTQAVLWAATLLVGLAASIDWWAPLFY